MRKNRFSRFWQLDRQRRAALIEAAWTMAAAQLALRLLPFRWIAPRLGRPTNSPSMEPVSAGQAQEARRVGWAIQTLAHRFPWDENCLAQAVAGKRMLQRRGLPSALYLGVDHGQEKWLEAHAWLRCGSEFVTGEPQHERFKVLVVFTEDRA